MAQKSGWLDRPGLISQAPGITCSTSALRSGPSSVLSVVTKGFWSTEFVAQMRKSLRGDQDQQTGLRRASKQALDWTQIVRAVTKAWDRPWEQLRHPRGCGARETALFLGRTRARLTLKELGSLSGGLHHNAVSIATRRFSLRLQRIVASSASSP